LLTGNAVGIDLAAENTNGGGVLLVRSDGDGTAGRSPYGEGDGG